MHVSLIDFEKITVVFTAVGRWLLLWDWHRDMCWDNRLLVKCKSCLHTDAF